MYSSQLHCGLLRLVIAMATGAASNATTAAVVPARTRAAELVKIVEGFPIRMPGRYGAPAGRRVVPRLSLLPTRIEQALHHRV